jgi:hypothetical protein
MSTLSSRANLTTFVPCINIWTNSTGKEKQACSQSDGWSSFKFHEESWQTWHEKSTAKHAQKAGDHSTTRNSKVRARQTSEEKASQSKDASWFSILFSQSFCVPERKTKQVLFLHKWEVCNSYFGKTSLLQRYQYQKVTALQQAGLPFSDAYLYTLDK